MRIAYANVNYDVKEFWGSQVHIRQFIERTTAEGHELWGWERTKHPAVHPLPSGIWQRAQTLRTMDLFYVRMEWKPPTVCRLGGAPYRSLLGFKHVVWEFNVAPGLTMKPDGKSLVRQDQLDGFRKYASGCDLAICVSEELEHYVKEHIGVRRTVVIPNGSDPERFHPGVAPAPRMANGKDVLNVVWIGDARIAWNNLALLKNVAQRFWDAGQHGIVFHIVGRGRHGMMREMPPNVHYYGVETYDHLPHWLVCMDVGLCIYGPGQGRYNSPLKFFDYLASGMVVITTPQPQIEGILNKQGHTDLVIPHGDVTRLAEVLESLAQDKDRVKRIGAANREVLINEYTWQRAIDDTLDAIAALRDA